ncbi:Cullin-associated NEDD8-dissociated protein 2 [Allomyces javanicus]|nr:Cullin-associated NEDD8-dissociated protein 2 [Allomyces javanicus]
MSSVSTQVISSLLSKMDSADADIRYMALNDLMAELARPEVTGLLDARYADKLVAAVLKLVADVNGGVQNLAIKCLAPLAQVVTPTTSASIADNLLAYLKPGAKDECRDLVAMGLKSLVADVAPASDAANKLMERVVPRVMEYMKLPTAAEATQADLLDLLTDLLTRFAPAIRQIDQVTSTLLVLLRHRKPTLRKRAAVALGHAVPLVANPDPLIVAVLKDAQQGNAAPAVRRTYVQCLGHVAKVAGADRVRAHVPAILTVVAAPLQQQADEDMDDAEAAAEEDELREACLQTLEAVLAACPSAIGPHAGTLVDSAVQWLQYDPNYVYDDDDDDEALDDQAGSGGGDQEDEEDEFDAGTDDEGQGYSDDEDMAWKVRRAAARFLTTFVAAIAAARDEQAMTAIVSRIFPVLTKRFEEREEGVRLEVLGTTTAVFRAIVSAHDAARGAAQIVQAAQTRLVRRLAKHVFRHKSHATRQAGFAVLRVAVPVLDWSSVEWAPIIAAVEATVADDKAAASGIATAGVGSAATVAALKSECFALLNAVCTLPANVVSGNVVASLATAVTVALDDKNYKVASDALAVAERMVPVLVASGHLETVHTLYANAIAKLLAAATALDDEVKERALLLLGTILAQAGTSAGLADKQDEWAAVLNKRLSNEVSRVTAAKVVLTIVSGAPGVTVPIRRDLADALVAELGQHVRKTVRALRETTLAALTELVRRYGSELNPAGVQALVEDVKDLVQAEDLPLAALALKTLAAAVAQVPDATLPAVEAQVYPIVLSLLAQPQIAGTHALDGVLALLRAVPAGHPAMRLYQALMGQPPTQPAVLAKAVAAVAPQTDVPQVVNMLRAMARDANQPAPARQLAVRALGELGRTTPIGSDVALVQDVVAYLSVEGDEELKTAAADALGLLAVGHATGVVPRLVQEMNQADQSSARRYLVFRSVKQLLVGAGAALPADVADALWADLWRQAKTERLEEGARLVLGECLGQLTRLDLATRGPQLQEALGTPEPAVRAVALGAFKYVLAHPVAGDAAILAPLVPAFAAAIGDSDLPVRRAALVAVQAAAHSRALLLAPVLTHVQPLLERELRVRPELVREVVMGPFKHKVDDGLETRKLAVETVMTMLDMPAAARHALNVESLARVIFEDLSDVHDVQLLAYQALAKLPVAAVKPVLDAMVKPVETAVFPKVKTNAVQQEVDKTNELMRAALRAVVTVVAHVPDLAVCAPTLAKLYETLRTSAVAGEVRTLEAAVAAAEAGRTNVGAEGM